MHLLLTAELQFTPYYSVSVFIKIKSVVSVKVVHRLLIQYNQSKFIYWPNWNTDKIISVAEIMFVWALPNKLWTVLNTPYTTLHLHLCTVIHLSHAISVLSHSPHQDCVLAFMALSDWSTWTPPLTFTILLYMFHSHTLLVRFSFFPFFCVYCQLQSVL